MLNLKLYLVTDRGLSGKIGKSIFDVAGEACRAGVNVVQYREKGLSSEKRTEEAKKLGEIAGKHGVLFIVNDSPETAKVAGADGVHLGQGDAGIAEARKIVGEDKIIGVTAHNVEEALEAEGRGADYVAASPIFDTSTKSDAGKAAGVELISKVKEAVKVPVVAIGGINSGNLAKVFAAGADGAAMVSEFVKRGNVGQTVRELKEIIR